MSSRPDDLPAEDDLEARWAPGSRFGKKCEASVAAKVIESLQRRDPNGATNAEAVVAEARRRASPLHPLFDWDDATAAHEHRLSTARKVLASIIVVRAEIGPVRSQALVSIQGVRSYVPMDRAMATPDLAAQVVAAALKELQAWEYRWRAYSTLAGLVAPVARVLKKHLKRQEREGAPRRGCHRKEARRTRRMAARSRGTPGTSQQRQKRKAQARVR